jgi:hypothetical protein
VGTSSAVAKVKNLVTGLPPTDAEVATVSRNPDALRALVHEWMGLPEYAGKMRSFFVNAFQQDQFSFRDLTFQFHGGIPFDAPEDVPLILEDLRESFARTAMQLVAEGAPFTSVMTTRRFMMTPALMALYAVLDQVQVDDHYNATDLFQQDIHTPVTFESARPIPLLRSIDPRSPDYMTFYEPALATTRASGCSRESLTYPAPAPLVIVADYLYNSMNGRGACFPPSTSRLGTVLEQADFTSWKMVGIREPVKGEATTRSFDLPAMRSGHELVLNVPRISFFSTPAFLARWPTNDSNQARVLMNQTLIVALGKPVDATNRTQPGTRWHHVDPNLRNQTVCHECHVALDPMRQSFRQSYSLYGSRQDDPGERRTPGLFAFHGVQASEAGIIQLASLLASHPLFATAWTQRLCTYAASQPCDESDPEFLRLVEVFKDSHYSWDALVEAVFSSPIATGLQPTKTTAANGGVFPLTRQEHLCALLVARLGIADVCGQDPNQPLFSPVMRTLAATWPSSQYSRGNATPALPAVPSLLTRGGMESLCTELSQRLVDTEPPIAAAGKRDPSLPKPCTLSSNDPTGAIQTLVASLMGLTSDRAAGPATILREHFAAAQKNGASATDAMRSTFVLACLSPYVAGIGQ